MHTAGARRGDSGVLGKAIVGTTVRSEGLRDLAKLGHLHEENEFYPFAKYQHPLTSGRCRNEHSSRRSELRSVCGQWDYRQSRTPLLE